MRKPVFIGIAGGSASGKTSISRKLYEMCKQQKSVTIIREDDYYKDQSHKDMSERVKTNYDHPFAFDHDLLVTHMDMLARREAISKPTYDYRVHTRSDVTETIEPSDVIILEGLFVLEEEAIRRRLDIKIFVDTDADLRFIRRLLRDVEERGRTLESVVTQYVSTVRVMHNEFIEPSKRYADVIVPEGRENSVAIDLLATKIDAILREQD
ncbi:MAG: uridine kinase [Erysipelotrichaceae bacterium]|nr:uridine kinase [Erysipelotrichaceae bacterium]MBQ9987984.1 uridine kinase [Erysipelotrichales bacterium]MBR3694359.1 uridine kinase [Erysipelotrichales bacterium]